VALVAPTATNADSAATAASPRATARTARIVFMASYSIVDCLVFPPRLLQHEDVVEPGGDGVALDAQSVALGAQLVYFVLHFLDRSLFAVVITPRPSNEQK